jgi:hypothetical protein
VDGAAGPQPARNLALSLDDRFEDIRFPIRDHGSNFTRSFDAVFQATGTTLRHTVVQAPRMNVICERLGGTPHRDQVHYNTARPPGHRPARPR